MKTRIWHTIYNAQNFFKESRSLIHFVGTAILGINKTLQTNVDIDGPKTVYILVIPVCTRFLDGLHQHSSLYRRIVKVTRRVFCQLNVCFLFWYVIMQYIILYVFIYTICLCKQADLILDWTRSIEYIGKDIALNKLEA